MYSPRKPNAKTYLAICNNCDSVRIEGQHKKPFYCHNCSGKVTAQLLPYQTAIALRQRHIEDIREKSKK